ncbi:MAG: tRNA-dihydrouridine synthase [Planctomycetes bacterium]|nr:tRNA-dihydrouridine synthase [Planctomycetota bacterium]
MLRIGPLTLKTPLLLAPIAGHCDLPFRVLCREQGGVGLASTDLLNSRAILNGSAKTIELAATSPADEPCGMQLYGNGDDPLPEAACWAVDHGARLIDINMGCPVDKVAKKHGGSLLLRDCSATTMLAERIVKAVERHTGGRVPVTAKMRLGWDPEHFVAPRLARDLESVGIQAVTVHGRWTVQFFSGKADWARIGEVVSAVRSIPVIGNGDVTEPMHVISILRETGCQGVMIGRGALRTPWIFRLAFDLLKMSVPDPSLLREPSTSDKLAMIRRHLALLESHHYSERQAIHMMKLRMGWYGKTIPNAKPLRESFRTAPSIRVMRDALSAFEQLQSSAKTLVDASYPLQTSLSKPGDRL